MSNLDKETLLKIEKEMNNEYFKNDIIFFSGSLIENIGNKFSDLDIFIITDEIDSITTTNYDYNHKKSKILFKNYCNVKCDIEIYDSNLIKKNIEILNTTDIDNRRIANIFSEIDSNIFLSFIHRLITGSCIRNIDKFKIIVSEIKLENYFLILKRFYQNQIENSYDDLVGNLYEKNYMTTILIGNNIIGSLIAYYLAKKNISIDRTKWGYIKLSNFATTNEEGAHILKKINPFLLGEIEKEVYAKQLMKLIDLIFNI